MPRAAVFAGASFDPHPMVHPVFQVVFPDGFVLIDTAMDEAALAAMRGGTFHEEAFRKVQGALARAKAIVVTHEHRDHVGGLAAYRPGDPLAGRLLLTREQLANTEQLDQAGVPSELRTTLEPLVYGRFHALAPGLVLVKAPGQGSRPRMRL